MSATPTTLQGNRKKIDKMNKTELQEEVKIHRKNEAQYKENLTNLRKEINETKEELKELRPLKEKYSPQDNLTTRMIAIEKRIAEQEQYFRRETVELVGLPDNTDDGELEDAVIKTFEEAGVKVTKRSFHVIHRLRNKKVVIVKLVNRRDALTLLRNKKKLRELSPDGKKKLKTNKVYVNESLFPSYKRILGKCNALLKNKYITSFFTFNGKIKITYEANNGNITSVVNHEEDLWEIFGKDIMDEINYERAAQ